LVNTVYVMAVASAAANVFSLMKVVDAMTRMATLASRGVEVTPEKLSRRYPEVSLLPACNATHPFQQQSMLPEMRQLLCCDCFALLASHCSSADLQQQGAGFSAWGT
jgi:hypothetical protein